MMTGRRRRRNYAGGRGAGCTGGDATATRYFRRFRRPTATARRYRRLLLVQRLPPVVHDAAAIGQASSPRLFFLLPPQRSGDGECCSTRWLRSWGSSSVFVVPALSRCGRLHRSASRSCAPGSLAKASSNGRRRQDCEGERLAEERVGQSLGRGQSLVGVVAKQPADEAQEALVLLPGDGGHRAWGTTGFRSDKTGVVVLAVVMVVLGRAIGGRCSMPRSSRGLLRWWWWRRADEPGNASLRA